MCHFESNCGSRLQQTITISRHRIPQRRDLSLPRRAAVGLSRIDGCRFQSALFLRTCKGQIQVVSYPPVANKRNRAVTARRRSRFDRLRHRFVLTPYEKRIVAFIIAVFLLGLITKCYRDDAHRLRSPPSTATTVKPRKATSAIAPHSSPERKLMP